MVGFPYLYWFLPVTRAVTLSMLFLLEGDWFSTRLKIGFIVIYL